MYSILIILLQLIIKIQTSCHGITEEDLAKLSVQLLNCQSEIEDRKLYPCTDKMVRENEALCINFTYLYSMNSLNIVKLYF